MPAPLHSLLSEPRFPGAPRRVTRDWLVVGAIVLSVAIEAAIRPELVLLTPALLVIVVLIGAVLWRRTSPLLSVAATFGSVIVINVASLFYDSATTEIYSTIWVLILVYSLFRWGSCPEAGAGLGLLVLTVISSTVADYTGVGDAVGGTIVLLFPAAIGATVREQSTARAQHAERIKVEERERIARELHDTVAHHISAIAIASQAGRLMAKSGSLSGAADALETIEEEASRTLVEMRSMVGLLRQEGSDSDLAPRQGIDEIDQLSSGRTPTIEITRTGSLESVSAPVGAAIFRLAQESVTNVTRHALDATRVDVVVHGGIEAIQLTVSDDGQLVSGSSRPPGYGLIGMAERVKLLGGTFQAGPGTKQGWVVQAELPRNPPTS